ncbi:MAG: DUF4168 domain-containing protein [Vibrio sp.]
MRQFTLIALVAALGAGVTTSAMADTQQNAQPQAQAQTQQVDVSDKQLSKFIEAQQSVNDIRQKAISKLSKTEAKDAMQKIQKQANQNMVESVKDSGLSVKDYNTIARALQSDKSLRQRMMQMQQG